MTTKLEAAALEALEALEAHADIGIKADKAITALREALEQPAQQEPTDWERIARVQDAKLRAMCDEPGGFEKLCEVMNRYEAAQQEPVAWLVESKHGNWAPYLEWSEPSYLETQVVTPLYTSPQPSKPWVGLTDREVELIDGMIKLNLNHATQCDRIGNRTMAEKQKGWDMERVELLRKLKEKNT